MAAKKSRQSYTAKFKLNVCELVETKSNRKAALQFDTDKKNVRTWRKMKTTLLAMTKTRKAQRYKSAKWPELERNLKQWVLEMRSKKLRITTTTIKLKAKLLT